MTKCVMVLPWKNGTIDIDMTNVNGYTVASYVPPPKDTPQYALVWLDASQDVIDKLTSRSDCLFICSRTNPEKDKDGKVVNEKSFEKTTVTTASRNATKSKVASMGFSGSKFRSLTDALQSCGNKSELAYALATKAFARDRDGTPMSESDVDGTYQ
jgi:hypothetical protein